VGAVVVVLGVGRVLRLVKACHQAIVCSLLPGLRAG
jgi:hypothetical protein